MTSGNNNLKVSTPTELLTDVSSPTAIPTNTPTNTPAPTSTPTPAPTNTPTVTPTPTTPPLKEVYRDKLEIGVALNNTTIGEKYSETVIRNFSSITCENEMKPDSVLDKEASVAGVAKDSTFIGVKFDAAANIIEFCKKNNIKMRFHTLVWHQQTPAWLFYENYDTNGKLADKETMKLRMKNYINAVISYLDEEQPGLVYTIDVVNEAFNGSGSYGTTNNDNLWYSTMGADYVYYAFLYAKEAIEASENMKDVTLVYNDYNMINKENTVGDGLEKIFAEHGAKPQDYIDAIGFQGHINIKVDIQKYMNVMKSFCERGYEVQITELDIAIPNVKVGREPSSVSLELQSRVYKRIMSGIMKLVDEGCNITSVTVWGISDDNSWLKNRDGYDSYALLWGNGMSYKKALRGFAMCEDVED